MRHYLLPLLLTLVSLPSWAQSVFFTLEPLAGCQNGLGRVKVTWSVLAGPLVRVLAGAEPNQVQVTGLERPQGSLETGYWVIEGMLFTLVDGDGRVIATARAALNCEGVDPLGGLLTGLGYFPLQVGNRWVYRSNSRFGTAGHYTVTITAVEVINGQTYYRMDGREALMRADEQGRLYVLRSEPAPAHEELFLDPTLSNAGSHRVSATSSPYRTSLGLFPSAVNYGLGGGLGSEQGTFVRGLGLLNYSRNAIGGSSGGFFDDAELVEARVAGKVYFRTPAPSIFLAVESRVLDVTGRRLRNCALPCYYVACGLVVPPPDPPDAYKPCFTSRIGVEEAPAGATVELTVRDSSGEARYRTSLAIRYPSETLEYSQLQLYRAINDLFPPGQYKVVARLLDAAAVELATAAISIEIR